MRDAIVRSLQVAAGRDKPGRAAHYAPVVPSTPGQGAAMNRTGRPALRILGALALLAALTACGGEAIAPEPPRPALIIEASVPAGASVGVYPGDIRAREESSLAFRVGGKVMSRRVDVGDRVRAGDVLAELDAADLRLQAEAADARVAAADAQLARVRADQGRFAALENRGSVELLKRDRRAAAREKSALCEQGVIATAGKRRDQAEACTEAPFPDRVLTAPLHARKPRLDLFGQCLVARRYVVLTHIFWAQNARVDQDLHGDAVGFVIKPHGPDRHP